jgi:hypothetical protein
VKIIITEHQYDLLSEMIKLDIKVGDTIMGGKFKNKKVVVKSIGKNDKGDITINGKPLLRFRIIKESDHTLLRRLGSFRDILEESLQFNDPCEYSRYEQYKRTVISYAVGIILVREKIKSPFKSVKQFDNFRDNVLYPLFEDRIKEHYHSFDGKC